MVPTAQAARVPGASGASTTKAAINSAGSTRRSRSVCRAESCHGKARYPDGPARRCRVQRGRTAVTCGGDFDRRRGHYRDNVLVFAVADSAADPLPDAVAG